MTAVSFEGYSNRFVIPCRRCRRFHFGLLFPGGLERPLHFVPRALARPRARRPLPRRLRVLRPPRRSSSCRSGGGAVGGGGHYIPARAARPAQVPAAVVVVHALGSAVPAVARLGKPFKGIFYLMESLNSRWAGLDLRFRIDNTIFYLSVTCHMLWFFF